MKITIVQGAFLPVPPLRGGAVEKVWFALGQEFARRGHKVTHISRKFPGLPQEENIEGVHHIRVPGFDAPRSLTVLKALDLLYSWRVFKRLPPADILVTNTFWLPLFVRSSSAGKLYVHVARYPRGQMRFYRHASRLQTVSHAIKFAIKAEVPGCSDKVSCIPYPLTSVPPSRPPTVGVPKESRLLYAGRIHPEKGVHLLVGAMVRLRDLVPPEWKLVLVGPWESSAGGGGRDYYEKLKRMASPASERIEFVGPVFDPLRLAEYYNAASLFIYPSLAERGETFGVAPLEAMSHGCPAVVSDLACFRDFISDKENGFVFNHRASSPEVELTAKLQGLLSHPAQIEDARPRAALSAKNFALERIAGLYIEDFESLGEVFQASASRAEVGAMI